jgi:2Fe-2S ferredoxin
MLDGAACERRANSRLSCQIVMSPEFDGIVVNLPERQV